MKRVYAAFVILLFLVVVMITSNWLVKDTSDKLLAQLEKIDTQCSQGDYISARNSIKALNQFFRHREHVMALFIKRDYLGTTAVCLGGLGAYVKEDNLQDLKSEIGKAKAQILMIDHLFFSML